jgi:hypothetical protein
VARKVVGIEAGRIERLARQFGPDLAVAGYLSVTVATVADVGEWRAAARKAARGLGEPVRTGVSGERVWAALDRPVTDAQRQTAARAIDDAFRDL